MIQRFRRHRFESPISQVFIQDTALAQLGIQMTVKSVRDPDIVSAGTLSIRGVFAHVANEKIQQSVVVEVKKHNSRRVSDVIHSCLVRDFPELAAAEILKERVATADSRDEKIRVAIIVNVGERSGDTDFLTKSDSG